ncbi:hypothetical protein ACLOJK_004540, partial [Asimina triloba]
MAASRNRAECSIVNLETHQLASSHRPIRKIDEHASISSNRGPQNPFESAQQISHPIMTSTEFWPSIGVHPASRL